MLCDYGCNEEARFILKNGKNCCSKRPSGCKILKQINSEKTTQAHKEGRHGYTYNPASNWAKGKQIIPNESVFCENSLYSNEMVKQRIVVNNLIDYKCNKCGIEEWCNETIILDLDHINGNNRDNRLENLRYLCPNCHSQTDTYKGRNKNTGKIKVSDQELLTAYKKHSNIRKALLEVGLAAKGGNYERLKKLIARVVEW
jgi:Zn finger protein HypA/HybF involved in hydrogenase expression